MSISIERARSILARFPKQRIFVVGDLMLDRYVYGSVSRISPEAPVPVVNVTHEKSMTGGASNVAWNIQSLGGRAAVGGVLGADQAGHEIRQILTSRGVSVQGAINGRGIRTTVKTRIIAERQQIVRVDEEDILELRGTFLQQFCKRMAREATRATGIIIADYGKGVIRQRVVDIVLKTVKKLKIPSGLDPKDDRHYTIRGITVVTPNRKEAFAMSGLKESPVHPQPLKDKMLLEAGRLLLKKWNPAILLITLGPQGMLLMSKKAAPCHIPARAREVFDVSGAGDTVIATCVLALAAGAKFIEAAELANFAAGVVVGKLGTATCTPLELLNYMTQWNRPT